MDTVQKAVKMMTDKFKQQNGENAKLDEDDELVGVFNDAVIIITFSCFK
jgi:hypothetical protein